MRRLAPLIVILAALGLYAARDAALKPFRPADLDIQVGSAAERVGPVDLDTRVLGPQESPGSFQVMPAATGQPAPAGEPADPIEGKIRRNSSLYVELRNVGVTPQDIDRIVRAAKKTYNLRRVRSGQKFAVYTSDEGVDSLFFYFDSEKYLSVRREGAKSFAAVIDTVPYNITYHVTEGTIQQSVFATLQEQNAETDLAAQMAEIFGWTIDFFTDIRRGDSFVVLYERKTYENGRSMLGNVLASLVVARGHEYHAFRFDSGRGRRGFYDENGNSLEKTLRRSPVKYTRVTSNFSHRRYHPVNKRYQPHYGVDFGAPHGTPVYTTGDGTVLAATRRSANGNYVKIKHNNTYTTYYLHLSRFAKGIRSGKRVKQGQVIGYVGATGWANGTHVCYRIRKNGSWVNPRRIKLPSKEPVPKTAMAQFQRTRDACLLRLNESILDGVDNRTTLVEQPSYPTAAQLQALF